MKKIMIVGITAFLTIVFVEIISVYATHEYLAEDILFSSNNESWEIDNTSTALDDIYIKQSEVITQKDSKISEQKTNMNSINSNINTIRSTITSKDSTINTQESTIKSLTSTNTRLLNQLNGLKNANCTSGSYAFVSSCTTTTGCKLLDFEPSIFVLNVIAGTTNNIWYYNEATSKWYGVYGSTSSSEYTKANIVFSDRTNSSNGEFYFINIASGWVGKTGYYIACE